MSENGRNRKQAEERQTNKRQLISPYPTPCLGLLLPQVLPVLKVLFTVGWLVQTLEAKWLAGRIFRMTYSMYLNPEDKERTGRKMNTPLLLL